MVFARTLMQEDVGVNMMDGTHVRKRVRSTPDRSSPNWYSALPACRRAGRAQEGRKQ